MVKNPLPMQETQESRVLSRGREDPLEGEMAAHSSILAWKIPWTEDPSPWGRQELDAAEHKHAYLNDKEKLRLEQRVLRYLHETF